MMNKILFMFIFAVFAFQKSIGQDILLLKDSTKQEVKLIEVKTESIKYKRFDYQDGPTYIISKYDVQKIIYQNGIEETILPSENKENSILTTQSIPTRSNNSNIESARSPKPELKIGDYIKFNIQAGIVINNSYCNKPSDDNPNIGHGSAENYSTAHNYTYFLNPNVNLNFLFGKSPYIKHIIGISYLRSHGEFDYHYGTGRDYTSYITELHYDSKLDYINIHSGLHVTFGKHFYAEPLLALNIIAHKNVRISGYSQTVQGSPYPNLYPTYTTSVTYYDNESANSDIKINNVTFSLNPKIGYDGFIKNQCLGIYASYNFNIKTVLPWWCIGVTYYPFKKLRSIPAPKRRP